MKADPEMVTRLFKWGKNCELGGQVNFLMVCEQLSGFCEQEKLILVLKRLASKLVDLPVILEKLNCPEEILNFPSIGARRIYIKCQSP